MAPSNTNEATNMSVDKSNNSFGIPKIQPSPSKSRSESSGKTRSKSRLSVSKTQSTRSGSNTKAPNSNNSGSNKSKKSSSESNRSSSENNKSTKSNTEITDQKKRKERNNLLRKFGKKMREGVIDENLMKKIMNLLPQENSENTEIPSKSISKSKSTSSKSKSTSSKSTSPKSKSKTSPTRSGTSIEQGRNRRRTPSKTPSPNRMNVNQTTPSSALKSALSMSHDRSVRGSASASPFSSPGRPRRRVSFANERNAGSQMQNKNANRNSTGARNNNGV